MFDRCLDEICTFDAMTASPFGPELIRQLLNVPSLTKFFATNTLISLSTAARTRCVLYLNPPDRYPANPDYEDHELAAVNLLQRHIPPASDHGAWIELLAKTLLPRASRRGDTFAEEAQVQRSDICSQPMPATMDFCPIDARNNIGNSMIVATLILQRR